jgi:hypothetical protein
MKAPSSKTLIAIAIISFIGAGLLIPTFYPAPIPVVGTDGSPMHGADGKILVYRDMAPFYRAMIPCEILFVCSVVITIWLLVRLFIFLYGRNKNRKTVT